MLQKVVSTPSCKLLFARIVSDGEIVLDGYWFSPLTLVFITLVMERYVLLIKVSSNFFE